MALIKINWQPSDRQLLQFGLISFIAFPLLAWWWHAGPTCVAAAAMAGGGLAILGWLCPRAVRPLFLALSVCTMPIGLIVSEVVMLTLFFGLIFPIGLLFRVIRRDAMSLHIDPQASSYWHSKKQAVDAADYYRQW